MIKQESLLDFEPRTFLLMLAAFIGNASVIGLDVVFFFIVPTVLLLQMKQRASIPQRSLMPLIGVILLLVVAAFRSSWLAIPYFDEYFLWAWKALSITLLVAFSRDLNWPLGNTVLLACITCLIVAVGDFKDGRLYSVFGPNMLYRLFGLLLFFSIIDLFRASIARRLIMSVFTVVAILFTLLTGSVGGIAMLVFILALSVASTITRKSHLLAYLVGFGLSVSLIYSIFLVSVLRASMSASRLAYKLANLSISSRYENWSALASSPFSIFGHSYEYYSSTWSALHQYPHNIFLELYGYYGILGICLSMVIIGGVFVALRRWRHRDSTAITFLVLLIGAQFSGDMSDNYGVVGLAAGLVIRHPRIRSGRRNLEKPKKSQRQLHAPATAFG